MYCNGEGVPQDFLAAAAWYTKAANEGNPLSQYGLGLMYYNGQGVPRDYTLASEWLTLAANQGNAHAQFILGMNSNHPIPPFFTRWLIIHLGVMCEFGLGGTQDYSKATEWYLKSAAQGKADAQFNIGIVPSI